MNNDEKRTKVLGLIDDLYGDGGMAVATMVMDYMSEEDWGNLYDRLEQDNMFDKPDEDDEDPTVKEALDYVRKELDEDELVVYKATVSKNLSQRLPAYMGLDDGRIIDLLEEYGDEHDLPEGWWENEGDIDNWLLKL